MKRKLPDEAFNYYLDLGVDRSYQAVAEHFGVSKVTVVGRAKRERWQAKLRKLEGEARERSEKKAAQEIEAVHLRQLQGARILQAKALEVLKALPPEKAVRAASALSIAWKHELLLLGDPTERQAQTVEEIVRRESERWLTAADGDSDGDAREA